MESFEAKAKVLDLISSRRWKFQYDVELSSGENYDVDLVLDRSNIRDTATEGYTSELQITNLIGDCKTLGINLKVLRVGETFEQLLTKAIVSLLKSQEFSYKDVFIFKEDDYYNIDVDISNIEIASAIKLDIMIRLTDLANAFGIDNVKIAFTSNFDNLLIETLTTLKVLAPISPDELHAAMRAAGYEIDLVSLNRGLDRLRKEKILVWLAGRGYVLTERGHLLIPINYGATSSDIQRGMHLAK